MTVVAIKSMKERIKVKRPMQYRGPSLEHLFFIYSVGLQGSPWMRAECNHDRHLLPHAYNHLFFFPFILLNTLQVGLYFSNNKKEKGIEARTLAQFKFEIRPSFFLNSSMYRLFMAHKHLDAFSLMHIPLFLLLFHRQLLLYCSRE